MKTYYFDNSEWVFSKKIVVISEKAFLEIQDNCKEGWMHHWLCEDFQSMKEAKQYFTQNWCK